MFCSPAKGGYGGGGPLRSVSQSPTSLLGGITFALFGSRKPTLTMEAAVKLLEAQVPVGGSMPFYTIIALSDFAELLRKDAGQYARLAAVLRERHWTSAKGLKGEVVWTRSAPPKEVPKPEEAVAQEDEDDLYAYFLGLRVARVPFAVDAFEEAGLVKIRKASTMDLAPCGEKEMTLLLCDLGSGHTHLPDIFKLLRSSAGPARHIRAIICADRAYNNFPLRDSAAHLLPPQVILLHTQKDTKNLTDLILLQSAHDWLNRYSAMCNILHICITSGDNLIRDAGAQTLHALSLADATTVATFTPSTALPDDVYRFVQENFVLPYAGDL